MSGIGSIAVPSESRRSAGLLCLSGLFLLAGGLCSGLQFAYWFMPVRCRCGSMVSTCNSNLRNISTALEMYAEDHCGQFPCGLSSLNPTYLKAQATCPASGDTYGYWVGGGASKQNPLRYYVYCKGDSHQLHGVKADHPAYDSTTGLDRGELPKPVWAPWSPCYGSGF
jgi:hypothetical protein